MAYVDVIKYEGDNKILIWKHTKTDFNTGTELIVHESQEAIFMVNGEVLDTFGPGKHILETENMPLARGFMKLVSGGRSAFHAELYFVNLTEQMAIKWGTDSKISYLDPVYDFPLEIGACGEMSLSVSNTNKMLVRVVGTDKVLTQEQLIKDFRAFLMTRAKSMIAQQIISKDISIFEIDMHLSELSTAVKEQLMDDFYDYGVKLNSFLITTVLKPYEDRNYLKFRDIYARRYTEVMEAELQQKLTLIDQQTKAQSTIMEAEAIAKKRELEGYTYQQEKGFEVAKTVASNEAIGQFSNVGVGLGIITGIGGEIGKAVSGVAGQVVQDAMTPRPELTTKSCPNCGKIIDSGMTFCENCGTRVIEDKCKNCGYVFNNTAQYCPKCGTKRGK